MNPEFIIRIIVRARNEIAGVLDKAAADVNKVTKAQEGNVRQGQRLSKTNKEVGESFTSLRKDYDEFVNSVKRGEKSTDEALFGLRQFKDEFNRLGRGQKPGSAIAADMNNAAMAVQRMSDRIKQQVEYQKRLQKEMLDNGMRVSAEMEADHKQRLANEIDAEQRAAAERKRLAQEVVDAVHDRDAQLEASSRRIADEEVKEATRVEAARAHFRATRARADKAEEDAGHRSVKRQQDQRAELERTIKVYDEFVDRIQKGDVAGERARLGLQQHASRLQRQAGRFDPGSNEALNAGQAAANAKGLIRELDRLEQKSSQTRGFLARMFDINPERIDAINQKLREFEASSNRGGFSAVRFAGNLRGMVIVGAIGFFQQLVGAGVALAGTLVSVAGAAVQAGTALAGMAAAAGSQALPVIGLLGAAWGRVGAVFDALKQQHKARLAAAYDDTQAANKQKTAADSMASAHEALAGAQRTAQVAQEGLTKARREAVRQIEDLVAAEKDALLQQEAARLALDDSRRTLSRSLASGNVDALAGDALAVRQNINQVGSSDRQAFRAHVDARRAVSGGVEGMDNVKAARRAVEDANRSIAAAQRGIDTAGDKSAQAAGKIATADRLLAQMLGDMSPAERRLYTTLKKVRDEYRKTFTGKGGVLESIIDAFNHGGERILKVLDDPVFIAAARSLSEGIAKQLNRIFDLFTSPAWTNFFIDMAGEAQKNLPVFTDLLINVLTIIRNISKASAPAFAILLRFLDDLSGKAADATGSDSGISKLEAFFLRGEKYTESMIKLAGAIGHLFLALMDAGGDAGGTAIDKATAKIREAGDWINAHQDEVKKFFDDALRATGYLISAVGDLAIALFSLFQPGQVKSFSEAFSKTLLPSLVDVLKVTGAISKIFLDVASSKVGGVLLRLAITSLLLNKALSPMLTLVGKVIVLFGTMMGRVKVVSAGLGLMKLRLSPLWLAISAVAAILLILKDRIHDMGDVMKILGIVVGGLAIIFSGPRGMTSAIMGTIGALEKLAAFGLAGRLGGLGVALGGILSKVTGILRGLPFIRGLSAGGTAVAGAESAAVSAASSTAAGATVRMTSSAAPAVAEGAGVAEAAGAGGGAGAIAKIGLGGLLKKAGWIGLGITAGQGIISGLKSGSVTTGFRDFLHSFTFGLTKSAAEIASEAARQLNDKLRKTSPVKQIDVTTSTDGPNRYFGGGRAGGVSAPSEGNKNKNLYNNLTPEQKSAFDTIQLLRQRMHEFMTQHVRKSIFDDFYNSLQQFAKTAPPEFKGVIDDMIGQAERGKKRIDGIFNDKVSVASFIADLGKELQGKKPDLDKIIASLPEKLKDLPKNMRPFAAQAVKNLASGLAEQKKLPADSADKIRKGVVDVMDKMRIQAVRKTKRMARDQVAVTNALGLAFHKSLQDGMLEPANQVLDQLGLKQIKIKSNAPTSGPMGPLNNPSDAFSSAGGDASGGYVGGKGQRSGDIIPRWLGRGEAVLNWAHQRVVEPGLAWAKAHGFPFGSLSEVFNKVRGKHGAERPAGMAGGGFVNTVGAHIDTPAERTIASDLAKLGRSMGVTFSPVGSRSARRTPGENAAVGGSPTSNHLMGRAMDVAPDLIKTIANSVLNRFGLNRPMPGNWTDGGGNVHDERNHIELLGAAARGAAGALSSAAASVANAVKHVHAPTVTGDGAMADIIRGIFKKTARGINAKMDSAGDSGATGVGGPAPPGQIRNWLTRALKLTHHFSQPNLSALYGRTMQESGGNPRAINLWDSNAKAGHPSKGLIQTIDSTFEKYRLRSLPDNIYNPVANAAAAIRYMFAAYGHIVGPSGTGYAGGGAVKGPGTGTSDSFYARLSNGEHIWTAAEVAAAGGHKVLYALRKIFGGGGQGGPNGYAQGGATLHIGDSLGVNIEKILGNYLKGRVRSVAVGGMNTDWGLDKLQHNLKKSFRNVIFDMGTNDGTAAMFERNLRRAYRMVGKDRQLYLPTMLGGNQRGEKNRYIREFAARHDNVTVIPWARIAREKNVTYDKYGHTYGGDAATRARAVAAAVNQGAGKGGYTQPTLHGIGFDAILKELNRAEKVAAKYKSQVVNNKFTDKLSKTFRTIVGEGGLLDQLSEAITTMSDKLNLDLRLATTKMTKAGNVITKMGAVKVADRTAANLEKVARALNKEQGEISGQIDDVSKRLDSKKLSHRERAYLVGVRRNLEKRLQAVRGQVADTLEGLRDAVSAGISARVDSIGQRAGATTTRLDRLQRMRDRLGGTAISALAAAFPATGRSRWALYDSNESMGRTRAANLNEQADALARVAARARRKGHSKEADAILQQVEDLRQDALDAVQAGLSADAEEITRQAGRKTAIMDAAGRVAAALGKITDVGSIVTARVDIINDQIVQLQKKRWAAAAGGFSDLAETIGDQITELQTSITEIVSQGLQDSIDQVNTAAERRSSQLDLRSRGADLLETAGNYTGAFAARGNILGDRRTMLNDQKGALSNLLMTAMLQGNIGAENALRDQIAELNMQLDENTAAIAANTVAARAASIEAITHRGGFLGGVFGNLGNLVTALDALTGGSSTGVQSGLLRQAIDVLRQTGSGYTDQLSSGFGIDLRGKSGMRLVEALRSLNYDRIEADFSPAQRDQFEDLINKIIENATAIETNTDALNKLNGNTTQSFSSIAWRMFRSAIFTGSGGLLPAYQIPMMDTGGSILSDGLIYGHSGEEIVAANVKRGSAGGGDDVLQLNVTTPTEVLDPNYIAEVISFKRGRKRAT